MDLMVAVGLNLLVDDEIGHDRGSFPCFSLERRFVGIELSLIGNGAIRCKFDPRTCYQIVRDGAGNLMLEDILSMPREKFGERPVDRI